MRVVIDTNIWISGLLYDDIFLLCAIEAQAKYIVTADRHLLDLGSYLTVDIITVQEFFELGLHNNAEGDS